MSYFRSVMEIKIAKNSEDWEGQIGLFTQSFDWGNILLAEGKVVERLVIKDAEQILAHAQVVYYWLPFGWRYVFCPKGPVINSAFKSQSPKILQLLVDYLKNKKCIFIRMEPETLLKTENENYFLKAVKDVNPKATLVLDLQNQEEDMLSKMHPKARYNIRLAVKKGVVVREEKSLEFFLKLSKETARRDRFRLHEINHYQMVLESPQSRQLIAYVENKPVATVVLYFYNDTVTYLYGASSYSYREWMSPYLLQWEAIKLAKNSGYKFYDFFGVAPRLVNGGSSGVIHDPSHKYAGVTRFKVGFGGKYKEDCGTIDLIIDAWAYRAYIFIRALRRVFP